MNDYIFHLRVKYPFNTLFRWSWDRFSTSTTVKATPQLHLILSQPILITLTITCQSTKIIMKNSWRVCKVTVCATKIKCLFFQHNNFWLKPGLIFGQQWQILNRSTHISSRIPLFSRVTLQNQKDSENDSDWSFKREVNARIGVIWPLIQEVQAAQVFHPDRGVHPNQPLLVLPAHICTNQYSLWHTHTADMPKTLIITVKIDFNF